jgi:hypothetical protein
MRLAKILLAGATLVAAALALAQSSVRPGRYEVTSETRIPGEPTATQSTDFDYITPEEAEDLQATLVELVSEDTCGLSNVDSSPGKMAFDSDCEGVVSHVEITFSAETIDLLLTMTIEGQTTTSTAQAKWIGPTCAAEDE